MANRLCYIFQRLQHDPSQIVAFEVYTDEAACDAHMNTPYMQETQAVFG